MKMRKLLLWFCLVGSWRAEAQIVTKPHEPVDGHDYSYVSIKVTPETAAKFSIVENERTLKHDDFVKSLKGEQCLLINAGPRDEQGLPLGFWVAKGMLLAKVNKNDGTKNFYLKPNGAFLTTATTVSVVETSAIDTAGVEWGIQSGPMLVLNGGINSTLGPSSINRHVRCGVGTSESGGDKYVHFVISNDPVTFYELASFFKEKLKCTSALGLESAGCDLYFPSRKSTYNAAGVVVYRYIKYPLQ